MVDETEQASTAFLKAMKDQQEYFMNLLSNMQKNVVSESAIPKFDVFDKDKENWDQYQRRFLHHLDVYGLTTNDKKRACLLSWVGPETYTLLVNLFGEANVAEQSFNDLCNRLSLHFKDKVHVQAARYAFYNCKMAKNQTYADWAATLRGLARDCQFTCKSAQCNHKRKLTSER